MSALGDWAEKAALDWLLLGATPTRPASLTCHLYTTDPADDDSGTECALTGYVAETVTFAAATSGTGVTSNDIVVTFADVSSGSASITHVAIKDNASNLLFHGALSVARTHSAAAPITFAVGDLICSLA